MQSNTDGQARALHRMVVVNERIKDVIQISAALNMVAINAMLVAKRAGARSLGFGVVSSELRVFSRKLIDEMEHLGGEIAVLVRDTAAMRKLERMHRLLEITLAQNARNAPLLSTALQRNALLYRDMSESVMQDVSQLHTLLLRSVRLCDAGYSLARSAKVEAAYGGDMSHALRQVADHIEEVVAPISPLLKSLRMELEEGVTA